VNVTIQVPGTFHAFRLAEQLQKKNYLERIITTNPHFVVRRYRPENVDLNRIYSIPVRVIQESFNRIPYVNQLEFTYYLNRIFEELACRKIDDPDIFVGWSGSSLKSIRKANEKGIITIVERGSSHIEFQNEILNEEYARFGTYKNIVDNRVIKKELKEYEEADYISIPSEFVKRTFIDNGVDEAKLIKVPYGVDISNLHFKNLIPTDIFTVLFFGGTPIRKGLIYLLNSWEQLDFKDSRLIVKTSSNKKIKDIFQRCTVNNVSFITEYLKDVNDLYKKADIFVLPTLEEGLSMVILEAMACGLPVIASENSGGKDVINDGENGFIVPIRDIKLLKEKIKYFYDNPGEIKRMGKNARKTAEEFTWDRYGERIVKEYKKIL